MRMERWKGRGGIGKFGGGGGIRFLVCVSQSGRPGLYFAVDCRRRWTAAHCFFLVSEWTARAACWTFLFLIFIFLVFLLFLFKRKRKVAVLSSSLCFFAYAWCILLNFSSNVRAGRVFVIFFFFLKWWFSCLVVVRACRRDSLSCVWRFVIDDVVGSVLWHSSFVLLYVFLFSVSGLLIAKVSVWWVIGFLLLSDQGTLAVWLRAFWLVTIFDGFCPVAVMADGRDDDAAAAAAAGSGAGRSEEYRRLVSVGLDTRVASKLEEIFTTGQQVFSHCWSGTCWWQFFFYSILQASWYTPSWTRGLWTPFRTSRSTGPRQCCSSFSSQTWSMSPTNQPSSAGSWRHTGNHNSSSPLSKPNNNQNPRYYKTGKRSGPSEWAPRLQVLRLLQLQLEQPAAVRARPETRRHRSTWNQSVKVPMRIRSERSSKGPATRST